MDAAVVKHPGNRNFFLNAEGNAGSLLAISKCRITYEEVIHVKSAIGVDSALAPGRHRLHAFVANSMPMA
jgi:selenophosphate synthetase-related protein